MALFLDGFINGRLLYEYVRTNSVSGIVRSPRLPVAILVPCRIPKNCETSLREY